MVRLALSNIGFLGSISLPYVPPPPPLPLLRYKSADVTGLSWVNSGSSGSAHNLAIVGSPQIVTAASGTTPQSVRFDGTGHYESASNVPSTLLGSAARTIGVRMLLETTSSVNIMGYGQPINYQIVDIISFTTIVVHYYNISYAGPTNITGVFIDFAIIIKDGSTNNATNFYLNGAISGPVNSTVIATAASKLRVGIGTYSALDNTARFSISGTWLLDRVCTTTEIKQIFTTL